ncbi:trypsin-like serine protease [Corynebacterium sp. Marseille-P4321]|uniref:trypsin-like serine protease n=1 Tax=Corynebacterium sp. Marseille-P4321 TaxID=2736603 RepID=UPI00158B3716|nr:trypsin-like serine protease [Corynebacterium sp. Marseille-P4321]
MKTLRNATAAVAAATILAQPAVALAAAPTVPVQGGAFTTGFSTCTIGYNDHVNGVSYTAAHCGRKGQRVALIDRQTNRTSRPMGTFYPSENYDHGYSNDWAIIKWDPGVKLGSNGFSGNTVLTLDEMERGDEVCWHGQTSHMNTENVECGTYFGRAGESFTVRAKNARSGDSGGPVWAPGRGFLGVISIGPNYEGKSGDARIGLYRWKGKEMGWMAAPRDGRKLSDWEAENLYTRTAGLTKGGAIDEIIGSANNASSEMGSSNSSSQSDLSSGGTVGDTGLSAGEIIAIVLGIATVVIPILAQLANMFM